MRERFRSTGSGSSLFSCIVVSFVFDGFRGFLERVKVRGSSWWRRRVIGGFVVGMI